MTVLLQSHYNVENQPGLLQRFESMTPRYPQVDMDVSEIELEAERHVIELLMVHCFDMALHGRRPRAFKSCSSQSWLLELLPEEITFIASVVAELAKGDFIPVLYSFREGIFTFHLIPKIEEE